MPYDVQIDHAKRIIVVTGSGAGTTADTLRLIDDLQETLRTCVGYNMLYDSTQLEIESSPADMMKVAEALFDRSRASFRKFAMVVPLQRVPLARIFSALAHPHGISANVFTSAAEARSWLGLTDDNPQ